ncbi:MAG: glutamate-1-semialdehyde 2,1-aminomutase [Candidatus Korobacteraceae bacterium]
MARNLDQSRELQKRAEKLIPGGVNSPVRAFRSVGGDPPFLVRGEGAYVWDADGNQYLDYVGSWGPLILGHSVPEVIDAIVHAARKGTSFGASTPTEADLAQLVCEAFPAVEKVRFVSSGTEATMSAIRLARAYTNRKYIVKFEGCYHGHSDALLVKAGSGVATLGIPGSAGVPEEFVQFTLALPYNNLTAMGEAFAKYKGQIACVIVEPVVGNMGCVPPSPGYLEELRSITEREGTVLILDEVMTGFRLAFGGASELYNIKADLVTMGKIIGGGLPVGAYGGPAKIMDLVAPLGPVYQAGTLSGNPLAMAAGITMLSQLKQNRRQYYRQLDEYAGKLVAGVLGAAKSAGVAMTANRVGSMFTFFFTDMTVTDWDSAATCDTAKFGRFHNAMLDAGIWLPPSQFEAAFLSVAHTPQDIERTITAAQEALKQV